ncbi:carbonic anhydrase [Streptomyces sp. NPDC007856]|uniref:carbonic anhydrase n=1 Tax=Streptomyces sp. NPDC007856 TaxID=3364781 RepID=UPI003697BDA0
MRRTEVAPSQRSGCSDFRLAAEIVFDRGLGHLFVVRTADHVMGPEVIGSIEYGVDVLDCPLVAVLGHDSCGAVGAACAPLEDGIAPAGYVRDVVERVTPSVLAARAAGRLSAGEILAERIRHTIDLLLDRSRVLAERGRRRTGRCGGPVLQPGRRNRTPRHRPWPGPTGGIRWAPTQAHRTASRRRVVRDLVDAADVTLVAHDPYEPADVVSVPVEYPQGAVAGRMWWGPLTSSPT